MRLVVTNLCKKRGKGKMKEVALCFEGFYLTRSFCNQHCCCLPGKTDPQEKGVKKNCFAKLRKYIIALQSMTKKVDPWDYITDRNVI